jgi:hypothetical protein
MVFNFVMANVNFGRALERGLGTETLIPLAEGLPEGWKRPGLAEAYREGVARGLIYPALHGLTHFHLGAARRLVGGDSTAGEKLRALYRHGTPQLAELLDEVGFEYYDPRGTWMEAEEQRGLIGLAGDYFRAMFGAGARSACAPGYRANGWTREAWRGEGIAAAQEGPGAVQLPHRDGNGLWRLYRTVELEPAIHPQWGADKAYGEADAAVARGAPVIVSVHALNFHSTIVNFRDGTLERLEGLLGYLARRYPNLRYAHDGDLAALYGGAGGGAGGGLNGVHARGRWQLSRTLARRWGRGRRG